MRNVLCAVVLLLAVALASSGHDYCIIGAGPGGLQMAELMRTAGMDYVVLEKAQEAGAFFARFPVARNLISINKRFVGTSNPGWSWRHDWNSLLNDRGLRVGNYTAAFYPTADVLHRYLRDFAKPLNVRYGFDVAAVRRRRLPDGPFEVRAAADGETVACQRVVVASGFSVAHVPPGLRGAELAERYVTFRPDDVSRYRNASVLIVGNGNSAFELADAMTHETALIHVAARRHVQLSYLTHYVGHVRAVNNRLLDHYQLKSLDGLLVMDANKITLYRRSDGRIGYYERDGPLDQPVPVDYEARCRRTGESQREGYDHVLLATGWRTNASFFGENVRPQFGLKYPKVKPDYESLNEPGLFFAGALMHSLDWQKSAGGFIHGFRYLVRALFDVLRTRYEGALLPHEEVHSADGLATAFLRRINEGHNSYQMFSVIGDVAVLPACGESFTQGVQLYHNVLVKNLMRYNFARRAARLLLFTFDYGPYHTGPHILKAHVAGELHPQESGFLHPVFREYVRNATSGRLELRQTFHLLEDFLTNFDSAKHHVDRLRHKCALLAACEAERYQEPAEVLTSDVFVDEAASADQLAFHTANLAQRLLAGGHGAQAVQTARTAMQLWADRPEKRFPLLVFVAFLEDDGAVLAEARRLAEQLHAPEVVEQMLEQHVVETAVLRDGDASADAAADAFLQRHHQRRDANEL